MLESGRQGDPLKLLDYLIAGCIGEGVGSWLSGWGVKKLKEAQVIE